MILSKVRQIIVTGAISRQTRAAIIFFFLMRSETLHVSSRTNLKCSQRVTTKLSRELFITSSSRTKQASAIRWCCLRLSSNVQVSALVMRLHNTIDSATNDATIIRLCWTNASHLEPELRTLLLRVRNQPSGQLILHFYSSSSPFTLRIDL